AIVPDPQLARELFADGVPHLPIRVRDGIGIVGPLVIPGKTSCLRCAHLHRTDLDPCWPAVATQLAGRTRPTELSSVHALASLATGQVLRALNPADRAPNAWNATLEVDPFEGEIQRRPWEPHPHRPCGAVHGARCALAATGAPTRSGTRRNRAAEPGAATTTDRLRQRRTGWAKPIRQGRIEHVTDLDEPTEEDNDSSLPHGSVARNARLARLPLGMASRAVGSWSRRIAGRNTANVQEELSAKSAEQLFEVLGSLKG